MGTLTAHSHGVLTIGRLASGTTAANYYLEQQVGCACSAAYYTAAGEQRGTWCGSASSMFGVGASIDEAGEALFRNLLAGRDASGRELVAPVWRGDPRGRVPAAALVRAVQRTLDSRGLSLGDLLLERGLARAYESARSSVEIDARLPRRPRASVPVELAGRIAAVAGVDPVEVFRTADGRDAFTEALAYAGEQVDVRRSGLDLTLSAPKSVSLLFGLGDEHLAEEVRAAHRAAVEQTVAYLEALCARAARGHHTPGQPYNRIATSGWSAVAFEHRTSRADDPQLHTHVVVPNVVQGVDGRWSAWDTSEAYRQASTGGYLYQAVLRGELTRRLGVRWGRVRRGVAEIEGVPAGLRRAFSTRRQAIEKHLAEHGRDGARAAQVAALVTRPAKTHRTDVELRERWRAQARAAGFWPQRILRDVVDDRLISVPIPIADEVAARVLGDRGVTAKASTFDRRDLLRAVCEAVPPGAPVTVEALRELATAVVRDTAVVPLIGDLPADARRYSTADLLVTEAAALRGATDRQGDRIAVVAAEAAEVAAANGGLSVEQRAAVYQLLSSGAGVEVVVGPAGSGKTAALRAAHAAWREAGVEVRGAAVAAIAARTLQAGTGIPSQSLTRLTSAIRAGDGLPTSGGVLVIDEAGMVGTRDLAWLTEVTNRARVKLVAIGDAAQLPEIDAGGLFDAWTRALPCIRLGGNLRQREEWERDALAVLRDGDVRTALDAYDGAGRLHLHDDASGARTAIIDDYLAARETGGEVVMLTSRRSDAQVLNTLARRALQDAGTLGRRSLVVPVGGRAMEWRLGDEALVTRNDYPRGLINGSRGRVTRVGDDGLTIDTDSGELGVPRLVLEAGGLAYGYALTCHKAQGITVDIALLYASRVLTRESGYVGMSRGRAENHLYGTLDALMPDVDAELDHPVDGPIAEEERTDLMRAALVARLEARGRQQLALTQSDAAARERVERWLTTGRDGSRGGARSR